MSDYIAPGLLDHQHVWEPSWVRTSATGSVDVEVCTVTGCDEIRESS